MIPSTPADANQPTGLIPQLSMIKYIAPEKITILPRLSNNGITLLLINFLFPLALLEEYQFIDSKNTLKKAKDHKLMVNNLKRGDKVVTSGGIVGTVDRIVDNDKIEILISENVIVEVVRDTGIQALLNNPEPKK